jgi:superfamily I DNA/RNA helicase/mRNA-degrading endonuclease RelE of RelBE toxin-antitoxin system
MISNIQLFIHDSFFDAFSVLPKQIQKRTRELLKKFKENPESSAINYEKISSFKDQSLRTVRVSDKYRAIVKAPENGSGFHLLWVDNHDEAMNWAKNKLFEWNHATQGFQLFEEPDYAAVTVPSASETNVSLFGHLSDEELLAIGTPSQMLNLVRSFVSHEDLSRSKDKLPVDLYEYLYYLSEGIPLEEILEDINAGKADENPMQSYNALKHTFIVTDDNQLEEILNGSFEKWKIFLHPSQRNLAYRNYNGPVKVTGGAGTGKTVCALHRVKYLVDKVGVFNPPVLFTTYTKSLTNYLRETIQSLGVTDEQVEITNIDKLILDLANNKQYSIFETKVGYLTAEQEKKLWAKAIDKVPTRFDEEFFYAEFNEVIVPLGIESPEAYHTASRISRTTRIGRKDKEEIWQVVTEFQHQKAGNFSKIELCMLLSNFFEKQKIKPFSHVVCDEIQDFSNPELKLLRSLVDEKENDLFLVGDPFQNIYKKTQNFSKSGISVKGRRSRKLKINYRTTEEIKHLAMKVVSEVPVDDFDGNPENMKGYLSLMHGNEPGYLTFNTPEEEDRFMLDQLNQFIINDLINPNEICICARTNYGLDEIKKVLNTAGFKYSDVGSLRHTATAINVSTFHNMKGHEFKIVLVRGMSEDKVPYKHGQYDQLSERERLQYDQQERALYYVVFSRAIQSLIISGIGEKSSWLKLINKPF